MSQKSTTTRKSVRFSETPLVRQYSNDYSADRKANSQTPEELKRAKINKDLEINITANSQGQLSKTPNTDVIRITRQPSLSDQRLQYLGSVTTPNFKNKGKIHKLKKMLGITKGGRKKTRGTRKKRSRRTRKNRYY
jgi:hypothetical protein